MLFNLPEDVSSQTKLNVEQALRFTETAADATEKLFELNVRTVKAASADVVSQIKALTSVKDLQELASLQSSFAQANAEKAMGYARAVFGWATETQTEVSKLVESQVAEINKNVAEVVERAAKSAPTCSDWFRVRLCCNKVRSDRGQPGLRRAEQGRQTSGGLHGDLDVSSCHTALEPDRYHQRRRIFAPQARCLISARLVALRASQRWQKKAPCPGPFCSLNLMFPAWRLAYRMRLQCGNSAVHVLHPPHRLP